MQPLFQALGVIKGNLIHQSGWAIALSDSALTIPVTEFAPHLNEWIQHNPEQAASHILWGCYPRSSEGVVAAIHLTTYQPDPQWEPNSFVISGRVLGQDKAAGILTVGIAPNWNGRKFEAFEVGIEGYLPGDAVNQFWRFECSLEGSTLQVQDAIQRLSQKPIKKATQAA